MSASPIRVLVADDYRLVRQGIAALCAEQADVTVVGEVGDGAAAVAAAGRLQPDVVLMDVRMPVQNGIEATAQISVAWPAVRVIIMTAHRDYRLVLEAIRAGARGYIVKDTDAAELVHAVRAVHRGEALIDAGTALRLLAEFRQAAGPDRPAAITPLDPLTDGEMAVLRLVALGRENHEIGTMLGLAPSTVSNRLSDIYAKLRVKNRTQAALEAHRRGWASLEEID